MENKTDNKFVFEDISSSSPSFKSEMISAHKEYSEGALRHIDKVIKAISFIVALIVLFVYSTLLRWNFLLVVFFLPFLRQTFP